MTTQAKNSRLASILNHEAILEEMTKGNITISDFDIDRLGSNSYDVNVGNWFYEAVCAPDGETWYIGPQWVESGEKISARPGR